MLKVISRFCAAVFWHWTYRRGRQKSIGFCFRRAGRCRRQGYSTNHETLQNALIQLQSYVSVRVSPTGSFRAYTFWNLSEARSQLYQRRFLRLKTHFSGFSKIYMFTFAPFQISAIFQDLCTIFLKQIRHNSC